MHELENKILVDIENWAQEIGVVQWCHGQSWDPLMSKVKKLLPTLTLVLENVQTLVSNVCGVA